MCVELRDVVGISAALVMAMVFLSMATIPLIRRARQTPLSRLLVFVAGAWIATAAAQKGQRGTRYVDASRPAGGDGMSWETAAKDINDVSEVMGNGSTIYVKAGTYTGFTFKSSERVDDCVYFIAVDGPERTIVEGGYIGYVGEVLTLSWRPGVLCGFTLRNLDENLYGFNLENCILTGLPSTYVVDSMLVNCLMIGNGSAENPTGALADFSQLINCTITGNHSLSALLRACDVYNSIIWGNGSGSSCSCMDGRQFGFNCLEYPIAGGTDLGGNITVDPLFIDATNGVWKLSMGSPCINTGTNSFNMLDVDLAGGARLTRGRLDMGCYEFQPTNDSQTITVPIPVEFSWLDQYCASAVAAAGGDYDVAVQGFSSNIVTAADGTRSYRPLWESYLIGLDPNDTNAQWHATIAVTNGVPTVGSDPYLSNRRYTVFGKHSLTDEVWSVESIDPHFFKVRVELQ